MVPEDPEAATESPVFEYESQVANSGNRSVVTTYTKILKQLQNRHGQVNLMPNTLEHYKLQHLWRRLEMRNSGNMKII